MHTPEYTPSNSYLIGSQGLKTFTFSAVVDNGADNYVFVNARPWEIIPCVNQDGTFNEELARSYGLVFTVKTVAVSVGNGAQK